MLVYLDKLFEETLNRQTQEISSISDPKYFEDIFRLYFKPLTYYAIRLVRDQDSAKDIVHTVFINLWERRESISLSKPLKAYLYTSVHNRCLNYLRDRTKFLEDDAGELEFLNELAEPGDSHIEQVETESRINEAINKLPEKCRQIFILNRFEEKKYSEIASELNISVKTVEGQISKALRVLRKELKDYLVMIIWFIAKIFLS